VLDDVQKLSFIVYFYFFLLTVWQKRGSVEIYFWHYRSITRTIDFLLALVLIAISNPLTIFVLLNIPPCLSFLLSVSVYFLLLIYSQFVSCSQQ